VFSYPEDDMVLDPKLAEHLAHFGINMQTMTKACLRESVDVFA
jgi:ubiquitin carboxyl-terminal hydrolase 5/13